VFDSAFAEEWEEEYHISVQAKPQEEVVEAEIVDEDTSQVKKTSTVKAKNNAGDKAVKKTAPPKKTTAKTASQKIKTKSKKSS
jgi:hypothetical protein